jgi:cyclic dehypoxanthinyl futalosine synthase
VDNVRVLDNARRAVSRVGEMEVRLPLIPGCNDDEDHLHALGRFVKEEATAVEYLKTLAISRLYLDNILNVQSSWVTQGLKTCQVGLRFGGNDVGSIMIEENVVSQAGAHHRSSEEELRRIIRDAGFVPKQRDTLYTTYFLN